MENVCDLHLLPPISTTMYWAFGRVKSPSTDALSLSDCMASIFLMVQNNAAASGSNAIFSCSGCSRDTIPACQMQQFLVRSLKEQYPVTGHAPNFDFWTGCREIKKCKESKRTLKNPFASRLVGFKTTLKLLRSTDQ